MTTMATDSKEQVDAQRCGCCGRTLPAERVTEPGTTPGVYICGSCAVWAARRSMRMPVVRLDPRLPVQWLRRRMQAARTATKRWASRSRSWPVLIWTALRPP